MSNNVSIEEEVKSLSVDNQLIGLFCPKTNTIDENSEDQVQMSTQLDMDQTAMHLNRRPNGKPIKRHITQGDDCPTCLLLHNELEELNQQNRVLRARIISARVERARLQAQVQHLLKLLNSKALELEQMNRLIAQGTRRSYA